MNRVGFFKAVSIRNSMLPEVGAVVRDAGTLEVSAASRGLGLITRYRVFFCRL
jgi:hypothetical protein